MENVIKDGLRTTSSFIRILQLPMDNGKWLHINGDEFQLHQIRNHIFLLRWNVQIIMGTVYNPNIRSLRFSYNDEETRSTVLRVFEVIMTALSGAECTSNKKLIKGYREAEKFFR